jgi:hypothetical protein
MWDISVTVDQNTTGVGTISGTWVDTDGAFSFSERTTIDAPGKATFISRAIFARDAWKQKIADDKAAADALLVLMNSSDPEVK